MAGFNKNLPKEEKFHCLLCMSSSQPTQLEDGTTNCADCGATIQSFLFQESAKPDESSSTTTSVK